MEVGWPIESRHVLLDLGGPNSRLTKR